jgi:predicted O-methyltransferase YrrM
MTLKLALKFLSYRIFSGHGKGHGIHSPFVFRLVTEIFRNKRDPNVVITIEKIRKKNLSDKRMIEVLDLGAGSSVMKTNRRKVSDIAKYSAVPQKYGILLASMAEEFGKQSIVEFGTSVGISTMYLASGNPGSVVYSMEGCPSIAAIAAENFSLSGLSNIRMLNGSFDELLPELTGKLTPGLVFIDGNHRKEPLLKYFESMTEISGPDTVILIDDIHTSPEMEEAWETIKQHGRVSFTVDIFRVGIIFFRQGMDHIDYIIRY